MERPLLSICISTYNRPIAVRDSLRRILACSSIQYDIVVQDCSTNDETFNVVSDINSSKIKYYRIDYKGGRPDDVMDNWRTVLLLGTGFYVLNLNDRDVLYSEELECFLHFLDINRGVAGGICIKHFGQPKVYDNRTYDAFLRIPYNSYHPSCLVFNRDFLDDIHQMSDMFTEARSLIHPHDLLLAELSLKGSLFNYSRKLWNYSDDNSFKDNQSYLYKKDVNMDELWFSPESRFREFSLCVEDIIAKKLDSYITFRKLLQVSKRYLYYATYNYRDYLCDEVQAAHYGYEPHRLNHDDILRIKNDFILQSKMFIAGQNIHVNNVYTISLNMYFTLLQPAVWIWHCLKK